MSGGSPSTRAFEPQYYLPRAALIIAAIATWRAIANFNTVDRIGLALRCGNPQETFRKQTPSFLLDPLRLPRYPAFPTLAAHDFGNLRGVGGDRYSIDSRSQMRNVPVMQYSIPDIRSSISWVAAIVSLVGITAVVMRVFETDEARAKSAKDERGKDLRSLAKKISGYDQEIHQRHPTGVVAVSVRDLGGQLRKRPDAVAKALNLLLREQKVEQASPATGYWKLNL